ncbi:uncharacterized protein LOC126621169 isoform X1 [Malus sylvestris]|uniref:uncharacterized protein LOC126621169 isoform X1 n=1 Tax=Malus sylvestris TaxID=3752 RepID=UPI0021ACEE3A|nr:uncharacterized protein LOC126621169 isoform X1 [Malus sylvestris]
MSSNYDNTVKKTIGGRKGYSAKLMNIFSTEFIIETADGMRQKKYKQGRDHGLMLVVEKMENLITLLMLLTFICKAEAAMVAKVRHKRLVNLIGLMIKVLNNPRCSLTHSELGSYISHHIILTIQLIILDLLNTIINFTSI